MDYFLLKVRFIYDFVNPVVNLMFSYFYMDRKFDPFQPKRRRLLPYNKDLLEHLQAGNTVKFVNAKKLLPITPLDKRIKEIRKLLPYIVMQSGLAISSFNNIALGLNNYMTAEYRFYSCSLPFSTDQPPYKKDDSNEN